MYQTPNSDEIDIEVQQVALPWPVKLGEIVVIYNLHSDGISSIDDVYFIN